VEVLGLSLFPSSENENENENRMEADPEQQVITLSRYKWLIRPLIHRNAIASLDWIGKSAPVPLLNENQ